MNLDCTSISVALPIHLATPWLESAFACISRQDFADLEILLVLNGSDRETRDRVYALARGDPRARVMELPQANLAAALNAALREARHTLVARMDGDDSCDTSRLRRQAEAMCADPSLAALGCAYRVRTPDGKCVFTVRPPTDAGEMRWRLLLGNMLAHGSMMLRRDAVLSIGGYDESLRRAQDFDLWLRLARTHRLAALPEVLYDYRAASESGADRSGPEQALVAARCMMREWRKLPDRDQSHAAERLVAGMLSREASPEHAKAALAAHLSAYGPTREALFAWNWAKARSPNAPTRAVTAARRALVRESTRRLREQGVERVWLYPAGSFTRSILEHPTDFAVEIAGVIDDHARDMRITDIPVSSPSVVLSGEHVLIASDWHEDALWDAAASLRTGGVRVHRLHEPANDDASAENLAPSELSRVTNPQSFVHPNTRSAKVA